MRHARCSRALARGLLPLGTALVLASAGVAQADSTPDPDRGLDFGAPAAYAGADAQYPVDPCVEGGPTQQDEEMAADLNGRLGADMAGAMDGYRVSCARAVVDATKERGIDRHAAVIAVTTVIVETHLQNINVPVDEDSLGLFQQRGHWGTPEQRLDPAWATNAFLDEMENLYPDGSWLQAEIGVVCQDVQRSGYPERYQPQAGDAQIIVDALWPV